MKYSNTIEYNINTKLDSSGLTKLQAQIKQLENSMQQMANRELLNSDKVQAAKTQLEGLNTALTNSFNSSLGILDLSKFRAELDSSGVSAAGLQSAFSMMGSEGQAALNGLTTQIANFNGGMERTSSTIDKVFTTFSNTFRWGLVSSFFSQFMNAIHSSVDYVKELDDSLTQIMLVTDYNRDSMNEFAKSANEAAKAVSMTTTGMTNASLIFAQQGYDLNQSQELATLSAKLANASQQDTATTSDQITAYMNAYGLEGSIEELTQAMDNWALIANVSAADVSELAQASQRAASMANAVGVSGEQLAAQIATIESVTREAPEQIGNGLKTLYARFSDIAAGGEDEDGFTLGKVTSQLQAIGVQIFDQMGQIRDVGDIMEDLMVIWDDLDQTSKVAASQALAGKYQVNRFMALMDNTDMYQEYKGATGSAAAGTLDEMSEEVASSFQGRATRLQTSLEGLFSTVFNTDDIYPWMDAAQGAIDLLQQFFDALGGGKTVLLGITTLLTQAFSQNMARSINDTLANRELMQIRQRNIEGVNDTLDRVGIDRNTGIGQYISNTAEQAKQGAINDAQYDAYMSNVQNWINAQTALTQSEEDLQDTIVALNMAYGKAVNENNAIFKDSETGAYNTQFAQDERANLDQTQINKIMSQADFSEAIAGARNYSISLQQLQALQEKYNSSAENSKQMMSQIAVASDQAQIALEQLYNTGVISDEMFENMQVAIEQTVKALQDDGEITEQTEKQLNDLISAMARFSNMAENMDPAQLKKMLLGGVDEFKKKENAVTFNQTQVDRADENAQKSRQNVDNQQDIKEILDTFNAVQQLTFAWQAFQNLGSLWANEDLSTGEKVLQTIMNLTMAMPQLIAAMQTLQNNSFLQNIGNGLLNILGPGSNFSDMASSVNTFQSFIQQGEEAQQVVDELQYKVDLAKQAMELREGLQSKLEEAGKAGSILQSDNAKNMSMKELQALSEEANKAKEYAKSLDEVKEATEGIIETGKEASEALKVNGEMLKNATKNGQEASQALDQMPGVFTKMYAASLAAGGGITGFKAALDVAKTSMLEFLSVSGPFLAIGLAIGAAAIAIGKVQEQAKKAHEQTMADFEDAKNAQQQVEEFSTKIDDWKSKRQQNGDSKELVQEADELADSLREAGYAAEANSIALAAARAEAKDTAEGYEALDQTLTNVKNTMSEDSYIDAMNKAQEVLKDQLSTIEEINAAKELLLNSGGQLGMQRLAETEGQKMHVYDAQDEATKRAGTEALTAATASWKSIDQYLKEIVPGYADIADEAERLAKAQEWATTEAQKAVITTRQLLLANQNLTEQGGAYDARNDYTTVGREGILNQLRNAGFTAEEQLKIIASFDDDATDQEITEGIARIQEQLKTNPDLTLAIRASLSEEDIQQSVERQLAGYQPKDEDVSQEDFQRLTDTFYENKEKMGEEGTPFEDFSETLFSNAEALERLIEGILRYNDAIASIDENYDKWNDALEANNIFSDEYQDTMEDLQDTYSDFLDLSEDLSEDFLSNAENLEKLKEASDGVAGSYEDLEKAAKEDIYMTVTDTDDLDVAEEKINEIYDLLDNPEYEAVDVGEVFDISAFPDLEESITNFLGNFKGSAEEAAAAIHDLYGIDIPVNNIVAAGDQATDSIDAITSTADSAVQAVTGMASGVASAAMGAQEGLSSALTGSTDVEVDGKTATATDNVQYTNLIPRAGETVSITSYMPVGNGNTGIGSGVTMEPFVAEVTGAAYDAESIEVPQPKQMTGQTVKTEYKPGDTGGGFTLKPGAMGTKAAPSGAKRSGGARPSSGGKGGGGGGKKSCFVAGTLVSTFLGFRPIEQIQKGDIVLSYNKSLGLNEYSEVLQTMIHDTIEPIYTLYIKNEQLRVTGIHRFLITDKITCGVPQWVHAADLKVGQWVLFADGTWHVIHKIEVNTEHQTVYNFEVSGNHNYYVGRNQILAHNKGGGGGKKGGGGGGKAKTIEPKEKKEHKKDYYEEVNSQLDKTEKILSKIEKEEDRLIGDKARANQNKQLGLLQKEITLNKEKQKIQQQELKDVDKLIKSRDKLAEKTAAEQGVLGFIPDVQLDEDGVVSNYEQISAEIDKIHNQLIDKYNAAAAKGDEELTKKIAKSIEKFDKYGDDLLKQIQRHNKLQSEIEATTEEIESLNDAIEDIRIDAYKAAQEAIDNLKDIQEAGAELDKLFRDFDDDPLSMNRWSLDETPYDKLIEDLSILDNSYSVTKEKATEFYDNLIAQKKKALSQTKDKDEQKAIQSSIAFFENQKTNLSNTDSLQNGLLGLSQQDLARLQGWMDNPNAADNPFGKNTAALYEAYQDAYKRTQDLFVEFQEKVRDTRDDILDIYDESEDKIERQMDQFDRLIEKVERVSDTYTLYYGEDSYDQLDKFYARQGDIMQNQLNKLTDAYNYWQAAYEKALATGDEKLIQEIQDKMDDAEDAMLDAAEELAELWVEKFENAVNASSQHIYRDLFGSNDIDELTDNWELQKDYMDRYKDDVEKAYEVDKLRNKYLDLLDSAQGASLQTQNRIRQQMQEQLDLLNNQKTVSEYDVKLANAKLEILQKQMALEDAQRNKNKMQLRRDTQGNYRYIYTADQGDVRGAQQDLEDSEYDAYEMTKDETTANSDRAINMLQQYIDKRAAIWNKFKDDSTARADALAQLEAEYQKNFDALAEDFTNTSEGMADILNWLVENGTENTTTAAIDMLNTLYDENGNLKEKTGQDWMDMASLIQDQVLPQIQDAVINADLEMEDQAEDLRDSMVGPDGALTKIGSGADDVADSMNKAATATSDLAGATDELFTALGSNDGKLQKALDKLKEYEDQLKNTQSSTVGLSNQLRQANQTIASKTAEAEHYKTALDFSTGARKVGEGSIVKLKKGTFVHYDRYGGVQQDEEGNTGWKLPQDMWVKFAKPVSGVPLPYAFYATGESLKSFGAKKNAGPNGSDSRGGVAPADERHHQAWWFDQQELQKNVLDAMDTGGYTGEWNESTPLWKDGKIAMLHQKELVLNATDTENILAAVNTVREMADAAKMSVGSMPEFKLAGTIKANKETIQQRVEISATFPNVSSITDIEQALLNISDQAYIYANKTI